MTGQTSITFKQSLDVDWHNSQQKKGCRRPGAEQLYCIIMTDSAHLIWRIRCERIIERGGRQQWHSAQEIKNRWYCAINKKLTLDQAMTNRRYEKKAVTIQTVLHTWSGTLQNELSQITGLISLWF